jgi:hypothetical protein
MLLLEFKFLTGRDRLIVGGGGCERRKAMARADEA